MSNSASFLSADAYSGPIQQLIAMGGPVVVVLLALAVIGLAAFFYLLLSAAVYAPRLSRSMKHALTDWQHRPRSACIETATNGNGWLSRQNPLRALMVSAMTARLKQKPEEPLRETLARDARAALEPFDAPLKVLEVVAALAPLLGLLGTVLGMMDSFSAMAGSEGQASAKQLSGGIYEALTTTAAGLIVAIPFAAIAAWAEFRLRRLNSLVNATLVSVLAPELPVSAAPAQHPEQAPVPQAHKARAAVEMPRSAESGLAHAVG